MAVAKAEKTSTGLLSIEVNAPTIVAGTNSTISLVIRNPFPEPVIVESIQAPSSAPLLPQREEERGDDSAREEGAVRAFFNSFAEATAALAIREVQVGPLVASFPRSSQQTVNISVEPNAKMTIKDAFSSNQDINIHAKEGSEVIYDPLSGRANKGKVDPSQNRVIAPQQEDLASFELKTAKWLFVKPKVLELHALIRYKVGDESRSQVVPVSLTIQPPVRSIIVGSVSGGVLGYLARLLNSGVKIEALPWEGGLISILGIAVMAVILSIVLSRQESTKGFVTLEDFYGAFVVGTVLGYTGIGYFENVINAGVLEGVQNAVTTGS